MSTDFINFCEELKEEIQSAYTGEISLTKAERISAKFLDGMWRVSDQLHSIELDARMKKAGLKAVKAGVYMEAATATDKKPSDTYIDNIINKSPLVNQQQDALDTVEVERDLLERYLGIFKEAHIYFRGMAKQSFGG